ncbi:hypothetical protein ILUMI_10972 [Ignelater luminosus]|uniref:Uncharacterized protein n=1 Tax=Ignelater luminosus TaxID=2038154 RepID=A0A8K0G860_IGNLU|nr:hypothetical protein ILUMI_10972 [Ignelater luminosus]
MNKLKWCTFNIILLLIITNPSNGVLTIIRDLLQYNVAGHPIQHKRTEWVFDPDVGIKRARLYQEVNGIHGEKAIERLGLGIDGNDQFRLEQQKTRDEGHLGGLDDLQP